MNIDDSARPAKTRRLKSISSVQGVRASAGDKWVSKRPDLRVA
jgi:hypothetical protein